MVGRENLVNISFFMPAFNCSRTIQESVDSIILGNFNPGDELIIVNDGSTDETAVVLEELQQYYPVIKTFAHITNMGGGVSRNTAIRNASHSLLFCLDSDNLLPAGSIAALKNYLIATGADVASFGEVHYFIANKNEISDQWIYKKQEYTLADYLSTLLIPACSGNYLFTKESWIRAGGYPEYVYALDTWGFGFRQAATGSRMVALPGSYYHHRHGYDSYWIREDRLRNNSHLALEVIKPFFYLIDERDVAYVQGEGRDIWFPNLDHRPLHVRK